MTPAELVGAARRRARLTQRQVAQRAGLTQPAVARVESGRHTPSLRTLERLLDGCGEQLVLDSVSADPHDLSLIDATVDLSFEQRIDRLLALQAFAVDLRAAVVAAG